MRRSRSISAKKQQFTLLTVLFVITVAIIGCIVFDSTKTQAAPAGISYKYYTSIQVQKGDTLWNIASEYLTDDYASMNDYIEEICEINHIADSDIHSGQYLTIPYYSDEYLE